MNPGDPIPYNSVVDCTDRNYIYTYSSGEAFYSCLQTIYGSSNIGYERPKDMNLYFIMDDEGGGSFVINYGVDNGEKEKPDIASTHLAVLPEIPIQY